MRIPFSLWVPALLLRPLKHLVPLPALVKAMQPLRRRHDAGSRADLIRDLNAYMLRKARPPFRAPGNCLERSLGAYRLLCAVGASPKLVVGVRPSTDGVDGHVWIELEGRVFGDDPERVAQYSTLTAFDDRGRHLSSGAGDGTRGIRWA